MSTDKAGDLIRRFDALESERSAFVSQWRELAQYFMPWRQWKAEVTSQMQGAKGTEYIFDSHPTYQLGKFANAIHSLLANPGATMFSLHVPDKRMMKDKEISRFLEESSEVLHSYLNSSNFHMEFNQACYDLGLFGTSPIYVDEHPVTMFRFSTYSVTDCVVAEASDGSVDTVFRKVPMTNRQAVQEYGDAVSSAVKQNSVDKPDGKITILHCVYPRHDYDPGKEDNRNLPWASVTIEHAGHHIIKESGYYEFPWCVPRLSKQTGELYGRSNGMVALADTKQLNKMVETNRKAGERIAKPPLQVPDDGYMMPIRIGPNAINFYNKQMQARIEAMPVPSQLPFVMELEQDKRSAITNAFHGDLLQLPINPNMTATEVVQRYQDQARILGPVGGRLFYEFFDPMVDRIFGICYRAGKLPPIPDLLMKWAEENPGSKIEVQYESPLMMGQKLQRAGALMRAFSNAGPLVQAVPEVLDNVDTDAVFLDICESSGVPQSWLKDPKQRDAIRQAKAEVMKEAADAASAERLVAGAKTAADAGLIDKSAGGIKPADIMQQMGMQQ
jgi:hypothetical protein